MCERERQREGGRGGGGEVMQLGMYLVPTVPGRYSPFPSLFLCKTHTHTHTHTHTRTHTHTCVCVCERESVCERERGGGRDDGRERER